MPVTAAWYRVDMLEDLLHYITDIVSLLCNLLLMDDIKLSMSRLIITQRNQILHIPVTTHSLNLVDILKYKNKQFRRNIHTDTLMLKIAAAKESTKTLK